MFYAAVETAVKHGANVIFSTSHRLMEYTLRAACLLYTSTRGETEAARMTLRPFAIRQRDGISYLLGTVYDARGADDTLRTCLLYTSGPTPHSQKAPRQAPATIWPWALFV